MRKSASVVICGAGIAGISAAYFLAKHGLKGIVLVDERPPLDLTSSRSTECYRNWWPDQAMIALMNRSIDLMEELATESSNRFRMNRRGYLYVTANERHIPVVMERAQRSSRLGAGPFRVHADNGAAYEPSKPDGYQGFPDGADLLLGGDLIQRHFRGISGQAVAALHVRRAGWLSAQQLGMFLLDSAQLMGVRFFRAKVTGVSTSGGRLTGVDLSTGDRLLAGMFVNAAGPFLRRVAALMDVDLPVHTELHLKAAFRDTLGAIDRHAPLLIWDDPQFLPWEADERAALASDEATRWLTEQFPSGAHARPEGGSGSSMALMLWEYHQGSAEPAWPPPLDPSYPEVALRGLATMLPGLRGYFGRVPKPQMDGGYYTKTLENRPLIGPCGLQGASVIGALSGYGIMSACAAGDLLAKHILEEPLPEYAPAFMLERYDDPAYLANNLQLGGSGQL
jgi:glycine/D-amino acid oxidase-like deaminating enzyme